ncbi:MAG: deoxynucleoside kinase [Saprospirales bacterium]|jgi:deoxyguanosine kinase|nr:deoxynucleoside kinase [Saprospirales bacterium]MBK7335078.1 deoxynucleoside kinase [Saprospirales bacterium]
MAQAFPHQFIAIEGNIGAGKTTLCKMLERDYPCRLVLEEFADNPFLSYFYDNPERYAFPVELFFLTERHKQLQEHLIQKDLFQETVVADYYFVKTLLFAQNNLNSEEYRLFQRLFHILNASFPKPDLLVYLHRPVEHLIRNIQRRGRAYELEIPSSYLESIQESYQDYFRSTDDLPILLIELGDCDFWSHEDQYFELTEMIRKKYSPGLHRRRLRAYL